MPQVDERMPRDPYELLGVPRDASEQDVKKAFRRLARELHPDVNAEDPQAADKFKEAAEAYEILSDPERRATYDRYGHQGLRSGGYAPNFDAFGSIGDLFSAFFGDSGLFGQDIFGAGAGAGAGAPQVGGDVATSVELELAQAAQGATVEVSYEVVERCERCHGNGAEPGTPIVTCERCGGAGRLQAVTRTPFGQMVRTAACELCEGSGRVPSERCKECRGRGVRAARRTEEVEVPAGIADGQRIRLAGRGHAGSAGARAGDLYVVVRVRDDPRFVREGQDLVTVLDVPAPLAALGASLDVPTLDGTSRVEVPAGTQPGELLTLRGKGMPALGRARRGNLRVVVNVVTPRRLTREQRALLERFNETLTQANIEPEESMFQKLHRTLRHQAA
jgi:molecular chaperone DnaJ